jgi:receptor protein-tyrosine kinase
VQASQALARTYTELFKSRNAFEAAVEQGELPVSAGQLRGATKVAYVTGTDLIQVQVTDTDPRQASTLANALAEAFIATRRNDNEATLDLADPASPSGAQAEGPSLKLNLALALLLGTPVGVAGALLLSRFRGYISSPEEIEELVEAPILGSLPRVRKDTKDPSKPAVSKDPSNAVASKEAISTVRVNLDSALDVTSNGSDKRTMDNMGNGSRRGTILVTSALPEEGKTVVSCSLAVSYARAGCECLIVDAALRKPQVHDYFSVPNVRGLSDMLVEEPELPHGSISTLEESVSKLEDIPNLTILTAGAIRSNPVDLLSSNRTQELIRSLQERFDIVILDGPPAFPLIDASILGRQANGIILVVNGETRRRDLLHTTHELRSHKGRIVGVVLNLVSKKEVAEGTDE